MCSAVTQPVFLCSPLCGAILSHRYLGLRLVEAARGVGLCSTQNSSRWGWKPEEMFRAPYTVVGESVVLRDSDQDRMEVPCSPSESPPSHPVLFS